MADLSKLSDEDLVALSKKDYKALSNEGLKYVNKNGLGQSTLKANILPTATPGNFQEAEINPTEGMSSLDLGLAGAGKAFADKALGVRQLVGNATNADVTEMRKRDKPLMDTTAGKVGNFMGEGAIATPLMAIPGANTAVGSAVAGAGLGLITPSESTDEAVMNTLGGAGIGYGVGKLTPKISQFLNGKEATVMPSAGASSVAPDANALSLTTTTNVNPTATVRGGGTVLGELGADPSAGLGVNQKSIAERAMKNGFQLTPGQATGSKSLQQMEARMESSPLFSGKFNAIKADNQKLGNRALAKELGENADEVSAPVLEKAYDRITTTLNSVADDVQRPIDPDKFLNNLGKVESEYEGLTSGLADHPLIKKYMSFAEKGQANGEQLNNLQSQIGKAAKNEMSKDPAKGMALFDVQNLILDDITSGLPKDKAAAFNEARQQYKTYISTVKNTAILNPSTGNVSGASLANYLQRTDPKGFSLGRNKDDLNEFARFSQAFKPLVGDSGTATRSMPLSPMEAVLSLPGNIVSSAYASKPVVKAAMASGNAMDNGVLPYEVSKRTRPYTRQLLNAFGIGAGPSADDFLFGNRSK